MPGVTQDPIFHWDGSYMSLDLGQPYRMTEGSSQAEQGLSAVYLASLMPIKARTKGD